MVQASQVTASVSVTVLASVLVYNIHELELMQRMYEGRHLTVRDPLQLPPCVGEFQVGCSIDSLLNSSLKKKHLKSKNST